MRKIYFYFTILFFSVLFGCERSELEADSKSQSNFVISVNAGNSDTRISVDGLTVKWKEGDQLKLYEIGEEGKFSKEILFDIDASSISEDGKNAKFTGMTLNVGKSYIAVYGNSRLNTSTGIAVLQNSILSGSTDYDETLENGLFMKSNIILIKELETPRFKMSHLNSIIECRIKLSSAIKTLHTLSKVTISSDFNCFLSSQNLNALDELTPGIVSKTISKEIKQNNMPLLSKDHDVIVAIPVLWNPAIGLVSGNFKITVYDTNGMESSITKPAISLLAGTNYESDILLENEFIDLVAKDREALVTFYNATGGENWKNNTNWCSEKPLKDWFGVTVNNDGRVCRLSLSGNQLIGSIPVELVQLTNLEGIWLSENKLKGAIPKELGQLTNLNRALWLNDNQLTGVIPKELALLTQIGSLNLSNNQLTGSIPAELRRLTKINHLFLSNNHFTGSIPAELGLIAADLYNLDLSSNQFTGSIPVELGRLIKLTHLNLSNNQLTGLIPVELGSITDLFNLDLSNNHLTGSIPVSFAQLIKLKEFNCSNNKLSTDNLSAELKSQKYFHLWVLTPQTSDSEGSLDDFNPDEL